MRLEPYKVGEEVKLINLENYPEYNNTKATVIQPLLPRKRINPVTMEVDGVLVCYKCKTYDGLQLGIRPDQIAPENTEPEKEKEVEEEF